MEKVNMFRILVFLLLMPLVLKGSAECENKIEVGIAKVIVKLPQNNIEFGDKRNISCIIYSDVLLGGNWMQTSHKLSREGNVLVGEIPVELLHSFVGVEINIDNRESIVGAVTLRCGISNEMELFYDVNNNIICNTRHSLINFREGADVINAVRRFEMAKSVVPREIYSDSEKYVRYEIEEIFPARLKTAFQGISLSDSWFDWVVNGFKMRYYASRLMTYKYDGERFYGINPPDPPIKFYSFLDEIDFSSVMLNIGAYGVKNILNGILSANALGIVPIQNTIIPEWQNDVSKKLSAVVHNPSQLLLDLLTAMAYIRQIEAGNKILTSIQVNNINTYLPEDLKTIIIKYNSSVASQLKAKSRIMDRSEDEEPFRMDILLDKYKGLPIVVDVWNTWCAPCIASHRKIERLKEKIGDEIVFIYVADTSSDIDRWHTYSERIEGIHVLLNERDSNSFNLVHGINAIPTYLFFDSNHNLKCVYTGFPGEDKFVEIVSGLSSE